VSSKLSLQLQDFFNEQEIESEAVASRFVQRKSSLTGYAFTDTMMHSEFGTKTKSLNDETAYLHLHHAITISKQGLDQRFSEASTLLLKRLVEKFLKEILPKESELEQFKDFQTVKIKDSTCFQLPESYEKEYRGSGGAGSKAMIRIQFEYDFKSGTIYDLSIHSFNHQDQTNSQETLGDIQAGDLLIRDLGYVNIKYLSHVDKNQAFYLNRPGSNIGMYEKNAAGKFKLIDYNKIKKMMETKKISIIEKEVYLSSKKNIKTRLVVELLPKDEYEKRIRKAKKEAVKKKRQLSKNYMSRAALNLFITNIPEQLRGADKLRSLYRIRWQVELIFKTWKSFGLLHETKKMKIKRFETNLYAKLLKILLNWKILWEAYSWYWGKGVFVSLIKFYKLLVGQQSEIKKSLQLGVDALSDELFKLFTMPKSMIQSEIRKGKLSLIKILLMN